LHPSSLEYELAKSFPCGILEMTSSNDFYPLIDSSLEAPLPIETHFSGTKVVSSMIAQMSG